MKSCDALIASGVSEARQKQLQSSVELLSERFTHDPIKRTVFRQDILKSPPILEGPVDYIFADIPYGNMTSWQTELDSGEIIMKLLENLSLVLSAGGILAICGDKSLRAASDAFERVEKLCAGKRLIYLLRRRNMSDNNIQN